MSKVEFDEGMSEITSRKILGEEIVPRSVNFLTKSGVVKTPKQAMYVLVTTIVLSLIAMITIPLLSNKNKNLVTPEMIKADTKLPYR